MIIKIYSWFYWASKIVKNSSFQNTTFLIELKLNKFLVSGFLFLVRACPEDTNGGRRICFWLLVSDINLYLANFLFGQHFSLQTNYSLDFIEGTCE